MFSHVFTRSRAVPSSGLREVREREEMEKPRKRGPFGEPPAPDAPDLRAAEVRG